MDERDTFEPGRFYCRYGYCVCEQAQEKSSEEAVKDGEGKGQ